MTVASMRRLDRFLGIPLCWLLGALLRLTGSKRARGAEEIRSILVIKLFGLGSVLLSTPALALLRQTHPRARLTYLSFLDNRTLLLRLPVVDEVLAIDNSNPAAFARDSLKVALRIRRARFDAVFDFEFFSKFSTLLSGISGAPRRVGFALPARWRSMILTHQVILSKERHVVHAFCSQTAPAGGDGAAPAIVPPAVTDADRRSLDNKLPAGSAPPTVLNVNAGSTFVERRWMPSRFALLVSRLRAESDSEFVFIGSVSEREYVEEVIRLVPGPHRCINAAGALSIPELCALFERSGVVISNDSGPLHLASAMGARVVALYGPEAPAFYGPVGTGAAVVYSDAPCSPCMNVYAAKSFRCPYGAACMRDIAVEDVERAIAEVHACR